MANVARENIMKRIKQALAKPVPVPFPASEGQDSVFKPSQKELEVEFAEKFTGLLGRFSYCENETELVAQLNALIAKRQWTKIFCKETALVDKLSNAGFSSDYYHQAVADCDAAITGCEKLIARTGSIIMSSAQQSGRTTSVYAPIHICIAYTDQLVYDIAGGLQQLRLAYGQSLPSLITLATGPSRTADIEKTLVVGVHGPKEVFSFLIDR
jgi:L-lactate dehydrogenase complex protein LldG